MKCSCCGKEISTSDKYCSNCGQNNDLFVEPVTNPIEEPKPKEQPVVDNKPKPITQISPNSNNQVSSNSSNREKKMVREIVAYILFGLTAIAFLIQAINGFKLFRNSAYPFASILGFLTPSIIGLILIITAKNKKK